MDLLLRHARVPGHNQPVDLAIHEDVITKIAPRPTGRTARTAEFDETPLAVLPRQSVPTRR